MVPLLALLWLEEKPAALLALEQARFQICNIDVTYRVYSPGVPDTEYVPRVWDGEKLWDRDEWNAAVASGRVTRHPVVQARLDRLAQAARGADARAAEPAPATDYGYL